MLYRIAALGWCCLLTLSLCLAQRQPRSSNPEAQRLFEQAEQQRTQANIPLAMQAYRQAFALDSYFVAPLNHLAALHQAAGNLDSTIYYYKRSLTIYPRGLMAHQNLATAYQLQGDATAAIDQYRELLRNYPDYPEAYYAVALTHYSQEQYTDAVLAAEQAMRIYLRGARNDRAADARMLAGQGYMSLKNYDSALKYFKASRKHVGDKPYFHYYVGYCLLMQEKWDKALEALRQAEAMGYQIPEYMKSQIQYAETKSK